MNMMREDQSRTVRRRMIELLDRDEIGGLILRYALSLDLRDWVMHRAVFADEIEMDFSASIGVGSGLRRVAADDWVAAVRPFFERLAATQHIGAPLLIEVNGDEASCVALLHAAHWCPGAPGGDVQRILGRYECSLVRAAGGWRITRIAQHVSWSDGNQRVFDEAAQAVAPVLDDNAGDAGARIDFFDVPAGAMVKAVSVRVRPDARSAFAAASDRVLATSRREADCTHYSVHERRGRSDEFLFLEVWRDRAAADAHALTRHVGGIMAAERAALAEPGAGRFFVASEAWTAKVEPAPRPLAFGTEPKWGE